MSASLTFGPACPSAGSWTRHAVDSCRHPSSQASFLIRLPWSRLGVGTWTSWAVRWGRAVGAGKVIKASCWWKAPMERACPLPAGPVAARDISHVFKVRWASSAIEAEIQDQSLGRAKSRRRTSFFLSGRSRATPTLQGWRCVAFLPHAGTACLASKTRTCWNRPLPI